MKDHIWMLARYAIIGGGGFLAGNGIVTKQQVAAVIENLPTIIDQVQAVVGAVTMLAGTLWGLYVKWGTKAVPDHIAARPSIPTVSAATGAIEPAEKYRG